MKRFDNFFYPTIQSRSTCNGVGSLHTRGKFSVTELSHCSSETCLWCWREEQQKPRANLLQKWKLTTDQWFPSCPVCIYCFPGLKMESSFFSCRKQNYRKLSNIYDLVILIFVASYWICGHTMLSESKNTLIILAS